LKGIEKIIWKAKKEGEQMKIRRTRQGKKISLTQSRLTQYSPQTLQFFVHLNTLTDRLTFKTEDRCSDHQVTLTDD
jgi:hypothetical protein